MVYIIVNSVMLHLEYGLQNCEWFYVAHSVVCRIVNSVMLHTECGLWNCERCDAAHRVWFMEL